MAGKRIVIPNYMPALDINGLPVSGAKLTFYENGTTSLKTVYTTSSLTVVHPNPVVANAAGVFPSIFADEDEEFSVAITDAADNPISGLRNKDDVRPSEVYGADNDAAQAAAVAAAASEEAIRELLEETGTVQTGSSVTFLQGGTGAVARTMQDKVRDRINVFDFFSPAEWADALTGTPAIDTTTKIQAAIDAAVAAGKVLEAYGTFRLTGTIIYKGPVAFSGAMFQYEGSPAIAAEISTGVGANPTTIFEQLDGNTIELPSMENMDKPGSGWAGQGIGLRMVNCQNVTVKVPLIHNFGIGIQLTSYTQSCLHNVIHVGLLLNNKVNIQLAVGDAGGSTNSNTFSGPGHCVHFSDEGEAVSGVRHIEIVPHPTRSIINHTVFDQISLEGTAEDYHVYDGGQSNNYINCRWETEDGPRFRQGQSSPAQSGQGGQHTIAYGYGVDLFNYLTISNDTDADQRITVLGVGLARRFASGATQLANSVGSGEPVLIGYASDWEPNTDDNEAVWCWWLSDTGLEGKMSDDVHPRIIYGFDASISMGNGTAAPTLVLGNVGSGSGAAVGKPLYMAGTGGVVPGVVGATDGILFFDETDGDGKLKLRLPDETVKTLAFV